MQSLHACPAPSWQRTRAPGRGRSLQDISEPCSERASHSAYPERLVSITCPALPPPPPFPQNELPSTLLTRAAVLRLQIVGGSVADPHPCVGGRLCRLLLVVTPQHSSLLPRLAGAGGGVNWCHSTAKLQTFSDRRMHWCTAACMDRAALRLRNALRFPDVDIRGGAHS